MSDLKQYLLKKIKDRTAVIGILGLGYVGLPLAIEAAKSGCDAIGFDVDSDKVAQILSLIHI